MFASSYFAPRYFAPPYFDGGAPVVLIGAMGGVFFAQESHPAWWSIESGVVFTDSRKGG